MGALWSMGSVWGPAGVCAREERGVGWLDCCTCFGWTEEGDTCRDEGVAGCEWGHEERQGARKSGFGVLWPEADDSTLTLPDSKNSKRITPGFDPAASGHCIFRVNASNGTPASPCRLL